MYKRLLLVICLIFFPHLVEGSRDSTRVDSTVIPAGNDLVIRSGGNVGLSGALTGTSGSSLIMQVGSSTTISGDLTLGSSVTNVTGELTATTIVNDSLNVDSGVLVVSPGENQVGIGTANPEGTLHAHTATAGAVTANAGYDDVIAENSAQGGMSALVPDASYGGYAVGSPTDNVGSLWVWQQSTGTMLLGTSQANGTVSLLSGNESTTMTLDSSGNVGIGTASPDANARVTVAGEANKNTIQHLGNATAGQSYGPVILAGTNASDYSLRVADQTGATEYLRVRGDGNVAIGMTSEGQRLGVTDPDNDGTTAIFRNSGNATPYGVVVDFSAASPDDNTRYFLLCEDSTTPRCYIWSDGDLANHDGTYGTISDERLKQDITDVVAAEWDKFKQLRFREYRMKTDVASGDSTKHFGLVAQELETVYPSMVDSMMDFENVAVADTTIIKRDALPDSLVIAQRVEQKPSGTRTKWIKSSNLHDKSMKVLQEAMARIEFLEDRVSDLEARIAALEKK